MQSEARRLGRGLGRLPAHRMHGGLALQCDHHHGLGAVSRWAKPSGAGAEMPGLPWPGVIAQDGQWHQFAVNYRRDPDDTTYTVTPVAGSRGRQVLRVHHPIGLNARSEHAGIKEAKPTLTR